MKEAIKSIAVNIGIGLPLITILYFSNPSMMKSLSTTHALLLGIGFAICKELVIYGLKK